MTARVLLRGGCVLALGAKTPNFPRADLLIDEGRVAEVGTGLRARDAEVIDASDAIVMPGFVDAHRHAWTSLAKNQGDPRPGGATQPIATLAGERYGADDVYAATLIGLLGAAEAGITTVVDWSDPLAGEGFADAALQAHVDAGLRTVFVHAVRSNRGEPAEPSATRHVVRRLAESCGPATTVALGYEEPGSADADWLASELRLPRELGAPVHVHAGSGHAGPGAVARLAEREILGADVTLVHHSELDERDLDAIAGSGAAVVLTPASEMAAGAGSPPIQQLIDHGIRPGLGVDDERRAPGDLFAQMRATISLQHATAFDRKLAGKSGVPRLMSTRDVIRSATADGARAVGLGGATGSLEPGMLADVIVLRTDRPNVFPINDPIGAVVWGMDTSNVDWVFVGGRAVMRHGVLEADVGRARDLATAARARVADAAGAVAAAPGGPA
jgi:cytosine/adenosine deaminase-related metal-dependent hydrolase